ncbi:pentapeptide repeat-containing protein [Hyalangium gracile]|uniref:pentapeptide repeat-containing protein n=1 Tax=Hyalangium gracile TaxID=394092 RepID=UPI001CC952CB|nr:pentapeptide repeat-containing protein [Hyalangium gracile]
MIQFSDREIENERLVLDSATEVSYLGHELTLRNCTLIIKVPARALVIARTHLIDCTIEAKRQLTNFQWNSAHLKGCRFKGRFIGNDFGAWPERPTEGGIEGCDFTDAYLDGCRFIACDVRTIRFPRWPCFTLFEPVRRWRELSAVPWPGGLGRKVEGFAERLPETAAVTYSAPELAKSYDTTPEAIRAVLEKLDGVEF